MCIIRVPAATRLQPGEETSLRGVDKSKRHVKVSSLLRQLRLLALKKFESGVDKNKKQGIVSDPLGDAPSGLNDGSIDEDWLSIFESVRR